MKKILTLLAVALVSTTSFAQTSLADLDGTYTVQGYEFKDYDMSPCTLNFTLSFDTETQTLTFADVNNGEIHVQTSNSCTLDGTTLTISQWLSDDYMVWAYYMDDEYNALDIEVEVNEDGSLRFLNGLSAGFYDEELEEQYDYEITSDAVAQRVVASGISPVQGNGCGVTGDTYYNMLGCKVSSPVAGNIYIRNGRKIILR